MNRQILKNILFNGLSFITNMVLMLMLTPYLVSHLGVIAYGFIPLAAIFTSYIGIVTESLTISINRNLTKAFQSNDKDEVKLVYNTSLVTVLLIIIILLLLVIYPVFELNQIISVPDFLLTDVKYLFSLLIISFLVSLISAVFSVSMYAKNRVDLMQVNNMLRNIVRVAFIVILFVSNEINLISVGVSTLIGSICSLVFSYFYKIKLIPYMNFDFRSFRYEKVKDILNMGGWLLVNQIGFVLFMKVDLFIINKYLGAEKSGLYSIAIQFNDVLRIFAGIISGVLGPAILILYSQNKIKAMVDLSYGFVKFLSLTISIPIIVICLWSEDILKFWMGDSYISLAPLVWILTLPLVINIGVQPLFSIQVAMNKIKIPALLNVLFGSLGIMLSICLITFTNLGYYGVAISSVIMLTIKNAIFTPIYTSMILDVNIMRFIYVHLKTILFSLMGILLIFCFKQYINISSVYELIAIIMMCSIILFLLSVVFYSKNEKVKFIKFIKEKI